MFGHIHRVLRGAARDRLAAGSRGDDLGVCRDDRGIRVDPYGRTRPGGLHGRVRRTPWEPLRRPPRA